MAKHMCLMNLLVKTMVTRSLLILFNFELFGVIKIGIDKLLYFYNCFAATDISDVERRLQKLPLKDNAIDSESIDDDDDNMSEPSSVLQPWGRNRNVLPSCMRMMSLHFTYCATIQSCKLFCFSHQTKDSRPTFKRHSKN